MSSKKAYFVLWIELGFLLSVVDILKIYKGVQRNGKKKCKK